MDCAAYRRAILAEPHADSADLRSHRASCHDCTQYTERLRRFDSRLDRALRLDANLMKDRAAAPSQIAAPQESAHQAAGPRIAPPQVNAARIAPPPRAASPLPVQARRMRSARHYRRWPAVAAMLLAVGVAGIAWLAAPGRSLAADVVGHMAEEPQAWTRTDIPVPRSKLDQVLRASQLRFKGDAGLVSYANSCLFRGHTVPHLVVQTESGPVTVMVLAHESSRSVVHFKEQGYQGEIVPLAGHGSLAVLERGAVTDVDAIQRVAARVQRAIEWTP